MTDTITNEQLTEWAGLGPWEWAVLSLKADDQDKDFPDEIFLRPGVLNTTNTDGTPWGDSIDKRNAALIAAAPALAAALLAERKAREVELRKLRDMVQTVRGLLTPDWRGYCDAAAAAQIIDQAMKGPTP